MKGSVFRAIALTVLLISGLPLSGSAAEDIPVKSTAKTGAGEYEHFVYLPMMGRNTSFLMPIIPATTNVLDDATANQLVAVSADGAIFTFAQTTSVLRALAPGEIMVAGVTPLTPDGVLRRVVTVSSDAGQIVVTTEPATLEDAVQQGEILLHLTLSSDDIQSMTQRPGVALAAEPTAAFQIPIQNVVLYDADGDPDTPGDQVKVNGSVTIAPSVGVTVTVRNSQVERWEFVSHATQQAQLVIAADANLSAQGRTAEVAQYRMAPITTMVGSVPVVFTPILSVYVGFDGSITTAMRTSLTHDVTASAGARYVAGQWMPIGNYSKQFRFDPPNIAAGGNFEAYIATPVELQVYGIAGPRAETRLSHQVESGVSLAFWWRLWGGIKTTVNTGDWIALPGGFAQTVIDERVFLAGTPPCAPYVEARFDGPQCDWRSWDNYHFRGGCLDGEFQIFLKQTSSGSWLNLADSLPSANFTLAADVRFATPTATWAGLMFGNTVTNRDFYRFLVLSNPAAFSLFKGNGETLISWRTHPAILPYPATNRLKVERDGADMRLYANDQHLITIQDASYLGSGIGFFTGSNQPNVDIRVDNYIAGPLGCAP